MKNLLISLSLFVVLLVFGLFVFKQTTEAQNNITANLLDLPAPPPNLPVETVERKRPENFYDKNNPPKDDASVDKLLDYWRIQSSAYTVSGYNIKPSDRVLENILAEIEKKPEMLSEFLNILPPKPETADFVKRIYDSKLSEPESEEGENYRASEIKKWLTFNSNYFSDELFKQAEKASETAEYVTNQDEVLALARVDWDRARPLLEKMLNDDGKPVSQTLARWAFYQHALAEKDSGDIEKYRRLLQETVENKNGKPGERDLAMDALVQSGDFDGRDDWYYTLLSDETLYDLRINDTTYTGLTTILNQSASGKYTAKMLELVKSDNPAVRSAAVRNLTTLLDEKNPEVVRALLPWLENPEWAKDIGGARQNLIRALTTFTMPESVPGLIAVLNEKAAPEKTGRMSGGMSNGSMANQMSVYSNSATGEHFPYRSAAIGALAKQKDGRAVSALRLVLPQVEAYERVNVVSALLASGGFSVAEQIEALELAAKNIGQQNNDNSTEGSMSNAGVMSNRSASVYPDSISETHIITNSAVVVNSMPYENYRRPYNPSELKSILGSQLAAATEVGDDLVAAMVERIGYFDTRDARIASALRKIMMNWQSAAVNSLLLRDLKNGRAETGAVVKLLSLRKDLREKQSNDVFDIRGGGAVALGISACLIEENGEYDAILAGENSEAKTAMLACARLVRANLPVRKVAENLQSPNVALALAAERYLESEDSTEARGIVLARHPNEAKILGATTYFAANDKSFDSEGSFLAELFASVTDATDFAPYYYLYDDASELKTAEKKLQKEIKENEQLLGVYAYDGNFIRIYKDRADYSWEEDAARFRERALTETEFNRFKSYLSANRADELPPFLSFCEEGCESKEFLMLGRQGGRRVFFKGDETPNFFKELEAMFDEMRKPPAKLHYWLEKNIHGLEILFADDNLQARAVWKNGDDFRVLLDDTERLKQIEKELRKQFRADEERAGEENIDYAKFAEERRKRVEQREFENFAWHKIEKNKLASAAVQPPQIEYIPPRDAFPVRATSRRWKTRTANLELRINQEGLFKISRGQISKVRSGFYMNPLVTPDGVWAIATKYFREEGVGIVRVDLQTSKEFKVRLDGYPSYEAVAFVPSINKVLIRGESYEREHEAEEITGKTGAYFLLDAQTGITQPVKGEIRPLAQQTFRPLQSTANAEEFWAAIPDGEKNETRVGIYNAKTFTFTSLLKVPQIEFDSMDMWADEKENKIYFVYEGHLLGLPLPKRGK
ncbi:MAG TPA: HEAT repeat domain-containing protein [Pyrinomonadaceae bacterium]|nr:HEAT repeat domain-containing protein [Pyrinomonadaceae bacterium]